MNVWNTLAQGSSYLWTDMDESALRKLVTSALKLKSVVLSLRSKTGETDMVSIADVGFGVSQVLPVLVALDCRGVGAVGLYRTAGDVPPPPRTGRVGASVSSCGETRRPCRRGNTQFAACFLRVQTLVAEGDLSPELVKLHWFTRDDNGATKIDTS